MVLLLLGMIKVKANTNLTINFGEPGSGSKYTASLSSTNDSNCNDFQYSADDGKSLVADILQQFSVKGKITDAETKQPLPGVNVIVQNTTRGVVTDNDGNYEIVIPSADAILEYSYIGYVSQTVAVEGRTIIDVEMVPEVKSLEEVMVIGYGTVTKRDLSTSVVKVDPSKIPSSANNSLPELLLGRAAGLQTNINSSQPGGNIDISIRGKGTPLIVVDGVIYPNRPLEPDNGSVELQGVNRGILAGLNPSDIESIEILKDASASIYGVSAGNGVILITTKKGQTGKMNVTYEGSRSVIENLPYLEPLNATDYMTYFNQLNLDKYLSDSPRLPGQYYAEKITILKYPLCLRKLRHLPLNSGGDWGGGICVTS